MTEMLYDHGAGDALAQAFKVQAQMLYEHADELMQAGNALVARTPTRCRRYRFSPHPSDTHKYGERHRQHHYKHSNAVLTSFHGMAHTDTTGAQSMGI